RSMCREVWGFESLRGHQTLPRTNVADAHVPQNAVSFEKGLRRFAFTMSLLDLFRRPCASSLPASFAEARPHLMPVLRGRWKSECSRLTNTGTPAGSLLLPFSS